MQCYFQKYCIQWVERQYGAGRPLPNQNYQLFCRANFTPGSLKEKGSYASVVICFSVRAFLNVSNTIY